MIQIDQNSLTSHISSPAIIVHYSLISYNYKLPIGMTTANKSIIS